MKPRRPSSSFLDVLMRRRFQSSDRMAHGLRPIRNNNSRRGTNQNKPSQKTFKGVHKGNYMRVKVPQSESSMMLLPSVMIFPPGISNIRAKTAALVDAATHPREWQHYWKQFQTWLLQNWGTIAMNVGSICTLIGFVRTDVLELRTFSMCGSFGAILYNLAQTPMRTPPIVWSATFAGVNAFKIYQILVERGAAVHLTAEEEETYNRFFLPHGVTPKQFETIYHKAKHVRVAKDECILRKDDPLEHVYLIVDGTTKANIRGRHLTAASFSPEAHETKQGGASGAWVGEMAFLEQYWIREQQKKQKAAAAAAEAESKQGTKKNSEQAEESVPVAAVSKENEGTEDGKDDSSDNTKTEETGNTGVKQRVAPGKGPPLVAKTPHALYSIIAKEDCRLLQWSHAEMEELLAKSTDLRAAMTRAMTQAIVGKTINFIVSKGSGVPTWSAWLDDWKHSSASDIKIETVPPGQTSLGLPEDGSLQRAQVMRGIATKDTVPDMV